MTNQQHSTNAGRLGRSVAFLFLCLAHLGQPAFALLGIACDVDCCCATDLAACCAAEEGVRFAPEPTGAGSCPCDARPVDVPTAPPGLPSAASCAESRAANGFRLLLAGAPPVLPLPPWNRAPAREYAGQTAAPGALEGVPSTLLLERGVIGFLAELSTARL